ncbi:GGDEF domain-containing protein [Alloalcanivorax mobilis]|uniref:GGDEF domain-containing protein n=1 Tax=Alloalcanivorax mobilis TaxID=2019569 RepID=UPI000B5B1134|nr:GGDEF domain-containing protein [Alloalcanivorax mobilis]ASK34675.1 GGDEF domain-containing protein [Alcanivorax sp. N3-2A]|tara:strand:- start:4766 stop:5866 length:1101 start_codon:yes stop_codon:yes gene_type:complete
MQGWLSLTLDRRQARRLSRLAFALLAGGTAHTLVCWLVLQWGFFRGDKDVFYPLFALIWCGHAAFLLFVRLGGNRRLRDPAMTEPLMLWSTLALLASTVFLEQGRLCVMGFFFAILQQGVFRIRQIQVIRMGTVAVGGYALVLAGLHATHTGLFDARLEWSQWLLFAVVTGAMVVLAGEIGAIRLRLGERNEQLTELLERIRNLAVRDELTGLYGRRHAMELLAKTCGQARRGAFTLGVAFVDLDHFKRINDRHGHLFGDRVLVRFAELTRRYLSERDVAARLGGEEFLLIMPVNDLSEARATVAGLMDALRAQRFMAAPALEVTASAGLTVVGADEGPDAVLVRADRLLYEAKAAGRDRIVAAPP